ncbi:murein L,D-transpeptidase YafK [Angulomicrobium tetraedrale]|uniref:Murein L,D-transpeptidase YafK n=1 Tax=Ancylobacter tetraedralis TaxID=217068 RepID=A0A839ZBZ1_9HYPH|nr:murein L,D-transpeptidase family protein [Ancylobacter tetraedralis]MBB3772264.1 murein L,D-transpeptidase YafK [Ancylobacter tetraedralis]
MNLSAFSRLVGGGAARWRMALLSGVAALSLAGCTGDDGPSPMMSKAMKTLSPQTVALLQEKGMSTDSPLVVRIFKEESELEVWKQTTNGDYALLKTYPICRWSGELGPKKTEGDRQAPEGFYTITPGQMNPNSSYYLSFDLGFPNPYDKALGRYGSNLMVHGDCSSRGCYAMTDEQVQEIFALGRESFRGGQRSFQVQAYPFRMTPENMVRHRNNPNLAFWKMLKEGSDTFDLTKAPPKVDYCSKRYVFNATPVDPSQKFQASSPCPAYTQPGDLGEELAARQRDVATRIASAGALVPVAPVKTGKDGGMHKVFLAKLENPELKAPGSLPPVVKPPGSDYGVATNEPAPAESIALATAASVPTTADVPLPSPRPTDLPPLSSQPAGTPTLPEPAAGLLAARSPAVTAPGTEVAALEGGGFLASVKSFFSAATSPATPPTTSPATETPASAAAAVVAPAGTPAARAAATPAGAAPANATTTVASPAAEAPAAAAPSSGFSLSSLFGGGSTRVAAPVAPTVPAEAAADVPVPPVRPVAVPQATSRASAAVVQHPVATAAPSARPAHAPANAAAAAGSAPAYAAVPTPGASYSTVPTPSAAAAAATPAVPTPAQASAAQASATAGQPLSGTAPALPGASILTSGSFSTTVQ